jgi:hypothetical protein
VEFRGASVLDVGCGRADLLDHLLARGAAPHEYIGLEAVEALARAAEEKHQPSATIFQADFIAEPRRMFTGSDIVVFCGSLNTLESDQFYLTLETAFEATVDRLVFNFLASPEIAAAEFLTWHRQKDVVNVARSLSSEVMVLDDYLRGDCTIAISRAEIERGE